MATHKAPFVRSAYNYDADLVSEETGLECKDPSMAQQNEKEEADINTIVRRFGLTGEMPQGFRIPQYGDFSEITDYQTALNAVKQANEAFLQLPAALRSRFHNDPEEFVEFCMDEKNYDEAVKLGLVVEKEPAVKGGVPPTEPAVKKEATVLAGEKGAHKDT